MSWQFQINGQPAGPVRRVKHEAMADAMTAGYASWKRHKVIKYRFVSLDREKGGAIVQIEEPA